MGLIKVAPETVWRVRAGRAISVGMIAVAIIAGGISWRVGIDWALALNAFLLGVNVMLAWFNWFVFET